MTITEFKNWFDPQLAAFLKRKIKKTNNAYYEKYLEQAFKISLSGGKRIRPYLIYLSYFRNKKNNKKELDYILNLLLSIEIFHIFCLIHDDFMDDDEMRHSQKTLHHFGETNLKINKHTSSSLAILIGDLFYLYSIELIIDYPKKVKEIFNDMTEKVFRGQFLDISLTRSGESNFKKIEEKNYLKTSAYTFIKPIEIGFALSGKTDVGFGEKIGKELGEAFQIQDDLLSINGNKRNTGKDKFSDIKNNCPTIFSEFIEKTKYKNAYLKLISKKEKDVEKITKTLNDSGSIDYGRKVFLEKITKAEKILATQNFKNEKDWGDLILKLKDRIK